MFILFTEGQWPFNFFVADSKKCEGEDSIGAAYGITLMEFNACDTNGFRGRSFKHWTLIKKHLFGFVLLILITTPSFS